jgi:hypothetical protein
MACTTPAKHLFSNTAHALCQFFAQGVPDLKQQLAALMEAKSRKWNFDFGEMKPLEGNWQWRETSVILRTRLPEEIALPTKNSMLNSSKPPETDTVSELSEPQS